MNAAEIATVLGRARREGRSWRCRCPIHGGRSLVLADGHEGRLLVRCWGGGCDPRDILAEIHRRGFGVGASYPWHGPQFDIRDDQRREVGRRAAALSVWQNARQAVGTPVEEYLAGRGITVAPPANLRFAPALRRLDGTHGPAMIGCVQNVDGTIVGVHRTWLSCDESGARRRRDRASLGPIGGGAVRLGQLDETLLVSEGVETGLAAVQATGMPVWAALSTSGMRALGLPPTVRDIVILADNDISGAGEHAARDAAARWLAENRRVRIAMPPEPGTDFADLLAGSASIGEMCNVAA